VFQESQIRIQLETVESEKLNLERAVQHMRERVAQAVEMRQKCDQLHDEIVAQQKLLLDSRLELNITHKKMGLKSLLDFRKLVPRRSSQYIPPQDYAEDGGRHDNTKERKKQIKNFQHLPPVDALGAAGGSTTLCSRPYAAGRNRNEDRALHISEGTSATDLPLSSPITQTPPTLLLDDKGQEVQQELASVIEYHTVQINAEDTVDEDRRGSPKASLTQQIHGTLRRSGVTQRKGKQLALARFRQIQKLNVHKTNAAGTNQIDKEGVQAEPLHTFEANLAMSIAEITSSANAAPGDILVEERPDVLEEGSQRETIQLERKSQDGTRSDSMNFHDTLECEDVSQGDTSAERPESQLEQEVPEDAKLQRKADTILPSPMAESKEILLRRKQERKHKKAQDADQRRKLRLEHRQKQPKPIQNAPVPFAVTRMPAPQTQDDPVQTDYRKQKEPASVVAAAHREVATAPTPQRPQDYDKMECRERTNRMNEHRKQRKKVRKAKMLERSCQDKQKRCGCLPLPLQKEAILN
jgi:hypothetical protein